MLNISHLLLDDIRRHCEAEYPHECCGALIGLSTGEKNTVSRIHPLGNAEPDSPQRRFVVDPGELNALDRALRADGLCETIVGFYHSHPDSAARPSSTDLEWAWEGYSYVIVSVRNGSAEATSSYRLDAGEDTARFIMEPIVTW